MVAHYAAGEGSDSSCEARAFVSLNWVLTEQPLDLETELVGGLVTGIVYSAAGYEACASSSRHNSAHTEPRFSQPAQALGFLNYLMLGTSASPLRKALNDSGLGESIIGGGVEDELRQPVFSLGLKVCSVAVAGGRPPMLLTLLTNPLTCRSCALRILFPDLQGVKEEDAAKVEALILDTLEQLEKEGFSQSAVEAAVNTIEFSLRWESALGWDGRHSGSQCF